MHAPISPSGMAQTVVCSGSVMMQMQFPQPPTDDSKAGDATHWVACEVLTAYKTDMGASVLPSDYIGKSDPAGTTITQEMAEGADVYTTHILKRVQELGAVRAMRVEQTINCPSVHPNACFGTPDSSLAIQISPTTWKVYVDDLKFGHGFVDEFENWQNMTYASGIIDALGVPYENVELELTIAQPRYYNASTVRTWNLSGAELLPYISTASYQAHKALSGDAELISGKHCRYCTARRACPAARQSAYWAMEVASQPMPQDIEPGALGIELDYLDRGIKAMEYMRSALLEQGESLCRSGIIVPGYGIEGTQGNRCWKMQDDQVIQVGDAIGVDLRNPKPISPAQAEKKFIDQSFIDAQTTRPRGTKFKRVKDNQAKKVFTQ